MYTINPHRSYCQVASKCSISLMYGVGAGDRMGERGQRETLKKPHTLGAHFFQVTYVS